MNLLLPKPTKRVPRQIEIRELGVVRQFFWNLMSKCGEIRTASGIRIEFDEDEIDEAIEGLQAIKRQRDAAAAGETKGGGG